MACVLLLPAVCNSADVVVVATGEDGSGRGQRTGEILDFTGRELTLVLPSGRRETIETQRVIEVQSAWEPQHLRGDEQFAQGKYRDALSYYQRARQNERRPWVLRRILAQEVRCYCNLGQIEQAGNSFLVVVGSDPATQYFESIPLCWKPFEGQGALAQQAQAWLDRTDVPESVLLGASWLLTSQQRQAVTALRGLSSSADARVALLAEAQLWRLRLPTATGEDVQRWRQLIERMPPAVRAGPYFVLGQTLLRMREFDEAALVLLRIPILFPGEHELSAEALLAAARALQQQQQPDEAAGLYREVVARFADTAAKGEAERQLQQMDSSGK